MPNLRVFLAARAYRALVRFEFLVARGDFAALYEEVSRCPLGAPSLAVDSVEPICAAVDLACIWYWREVLCLQRSAATACLLKQAGVPAQLIIGVQHTPFKAHAWVEVDGRVVNDHASVRHLYAFLDRC